MTVNSNIAELIHAGTVVANITFYRDLMLISSANSNRMSSTSIVHLHGC